MRQQGCHVVGLEFAAQAVDEFFADNKIEFEIEKFDDYEIYTADGYKIYRGDFFKIPIAEKFDFIYDRASLVAIDPELKPVSKNIFSSAQYKLISELCRENEETYEWRNAVSSFSP